jgi:hypothetical protein
VSLATINGEMLTSARVTFPRTGAWIYDGSTATGEVTEGSTATLTIADDMTITGTVIRSVEFEGATRFRAIGGKGGWTAPVRPKAYTSSAGLSFAPIAQDAARESGETLGTSLPKDSVGTQYTRRSGPASQVFALLPDGTDWWIDDAGVTQFGQRSTGLIMTEFQSMDYDGRLGVLAMATDAPGAFRPGKTIAAPNIGERIINAVVWLVTTDALRGELWIG